jgi:O-antigen ligase
MKMVFSIKDKSNLLKFVFFSLAVLITVAVQSVYVSTFLFSLLIFWDRRFILSVLFFIPTIETLVIATEGLTVTKLLAVLIGMYFLIYLLFDQPLFDKDSGLLVCFIGLLLFSTAYSVLDFRPDLAYSELFNFLLTVLPKLLFAVFLYLFFKKRGKGFLKKNLLYALNTIPVGLIILTIYFIFWGYTEINWYNIVTRKVIEGTDPNEFGGMLAALSVFPLYNVMKRDRKLLTAISIVSLGLVLYSITITLSRGAILSFVFMGLVSIVILTKASFSKTMKYGIGVIIVILGFIQSGVIDLYTILQRFTGKFVEDNINSLTANRYSLWVAGLEAFQKNIFIGFGNSDAVIRNINQKALGADKLFHNMYIEILVRTGLIGFMIFIGILAKSQRGIIQYFKGLAKQDNIILILPLLALIVMCFSAFGLSWQWRELLWYFIAISLISSRMITRRG